MQRVFVITDDIFEKAAQGDAEAQFTLGRCTRPKSGGKTSEWRLASPENDYYEFDARFLKYPLRPASMHHTKHPFIPRVISVR
jgi:hypothetical protein